MTPHQSAAAAPDTPYKYSDTKPRQTSNSATSEGMLVDHWPHTAQQPGGGGALDNQRVPSGDRRTDPEGHLGRESRMNYLPASSGVATAPLPARTRSLRERLWTQRMLALYRSGRQAEALRVFQDLRTFLVAELGIERRTG